MESDSVVHTSGGGESTLFVKKLFINAGLMVDVSVSIFLSARKKGVCIFT